MVLKVNYHLPKDARAMEQFTSLGEGSRWRCVMDLGLTLEVQGRKVICYDSLSVTESRHTFLGTKLDSCTCG